MQLQQIFREGKEDKESVYKIAAAFLAVVIGPQFHESRNRYPSDQVDLAFSGAWGAAKESATRKYFEAMFASDYQIMMKIKKEASGFALYHHGSLQHLEAQYAQYQYLQNLQHVQRAAAFPPGGSHHHSSPVGASFVQRVPSGAGVAMGPPSRYTSYASVPPRSAPQSYRQQSPAHSGLAVNPHGGDGGPTASHSIQYPQVWSRPG